LPYRKSEVEAGRALPPRPHSTMPAPARAPGALYIACKSYDCLFFIGAPWLGLALAAVFFTYQWQSHDLTAEGRFSWSLKTLLLGQIFTQAHIFLVFFRSHARRDLFRAHRWRFTAVPALVVALFWVSKTLFLLGLVLRFYWDIYHASLQTFGLGRIY